MTSVFSITFGANTMAIQLTSTSTTEVITKGQVQDVHPVKKLNMVPTVPNPSTMSTNYGVVVVLKSSSNPETAPRTLTIPMNVANQATWTNTVAGQQQAITDIAAWMNT